MKKTSTLLSLLLISINVFGQSHTETFESFTLAANSAYSSTISASFSGVSTTYQYQWDTTYSIWDGGFSYTNIHDSSTAGYSNLYGVRALKGYNNSNQYAVGQNFGIIKLNSPYKGVEGFYITNTTYAYKSMWLGDGFAKKFGGASGNDPDFFKVTVKGFLNGMMLTDSVEVYLADFRSSNNAQDYILDTWQWVNTMPLGEVDSIQFFMYSSDNGSFGMNTPAFFALDNVTSSPSFVGLNEITSLLDIKLYPNPAKDYVKIDPSIESALITISDYAGKIIKQIHYSKNSNIDLSDMQSGLYFIEVSSGDKQYQAKLIKK